MRAAPGIAALAAAAALSLVAAPGLAAPAPADEHAGAARAIGMSKKPLREHSGWRRYVADSRTRVVYPAVVTGAGSPGYIQNAAGLKLDDRSAATLRRDFLGQGFLVVDLGTNVGGVVEVGAGSVTGGPVRVSYSEGSRFLQPGGDMRGAVSLGINDDPNGRSDLVGAPGLFASRGIRGAQRYMLITLEGNGSAAIDFVRVRVRHLRPAPRDYSGRFYSSSRLLNRIWFAGAHTLNLNAVRDARFRGRRRVLVDGGKRDRLLWIGDLALQSLAAHYTVRQQPAIVARSLRAFSCQQYRSGYIPMTSDIHVRCGRPGPPDGPPPKARIGYAPLFAEDRLPEYTAWWVIAVADWYRLTGNARATRRYLPVMRRTVGYLRSHRNPGGLFRTPRGAINWRAFDEAAGVDTHTNATWVRALRRLASVERRLGSPARSRRYRRLAARMAQRMRAELYDREAGLFIANARPRRRNHSQDANVGAVLAGVVSGRRAGGILRRARRLLWTPYGPATGELSGDPYVSRYISPFMTGWELIARLQRHQGWAARQLLLDHWGRMLAAGPGTTWEAMGLDGAPVSFDDGRVWQGRTSLSHGWGSAPTYALSAYVAGIRPLAPGWSEWLAEPQRLGLRFAGARVRTPRGPAVARWRVFGSERALKVTVRGPRGASGIVAVPLLGEPRTIARDGRIVWRDGHPVRGVRAWRQGGYVRFRQAGGRHTYAWFGVGRAARRQLSVAPAAPALQGSGDGTAGRGGPLPAPRQERGQAGPVGRAEEAGGAAAGTRGPDRPEAAGTAAVRGDGGVGRLGQGRGDQADGG